MATHFHTGSHHGICKTLVRAFGALIGVVFAAGMLQPSFAAAQKASEEEPSEAHAVGALRTINTAAVTYASTYKKGFSPTLAAMGMKPNQKEPSETAAGLIDERLTVGKLGGYIFTYKAGKRDKDGRINAYTVSARPTKWRMGLSSFFSDQTGLIRSTAENRAATAKDPPVE